MCNVRRNNSKLKFLEGIFFSLISALDGLMELFGDVPFFLISAVDGLMELFGDVPGIMWGHTRSRTTFVQGTGSVWYWLGMQGKRAFGCWHVSKGRFLHYGRRSRGRRFSPMFKIEVFNAFQTRFGPSKYTSLKTTLQNATPNWKWRRHLKSSIQFVHHKN